MDLLRELFQRSDATGSRSTVLMDLRWIVGILMAGLIAAFKYNVATWIIVLVFALLLAALAGVGVAFAYFARKKPDLLRSERYALSKMAIERGLVLGDTDKGLKRVESEDKTRAKLASESRRLQ